MAYLVEIFFIYLNDAIFLSIYFCVSSVCWVAVNNQSWTLEILTFYISIYKNVINKKLCVRFFLSRCEDKCACNYVIC